MRDDEGLRAAKHWVALWKKRENSNDFFFSNSVIPLKHERKWNRIDFRTFRLWRRERKAWKKILLTTGNHSIMKFVREKKKLFPFQNVRHFASSPSSSFDPSSQMLSVCGPRHPSYCRARSELITAENEMMMKMSVHDSIFDFYFRFLLPFPPFLLTRHFVTFICLLLLWRKSAPSWVRRGKRKR